MHTLNTNSRRAASLMPKWNYQCNFSLKPEMTAYFIVYTMIIMCLHAYHVYLYFNNQPTRYRYYFYFLLFLQCPIYRYEILCSVAPLRQLTVMLPIHSKLCQVPLSTVSQAELQHLQKFHIVSRVRHNGFLTLDRKCCTFLQHLINREMFYSSHLPSRRYI